MGSRVVAQQSDYLELLRNTQENLAKVKQWEQQFNIAQQNIETKTAYDISGAFANYKKQQRNLQSNPYLSTGFKDEIANDLFGQYDVTYSGLKRQQQQAESQITENYLTKIMSNDEELAKQATNYAKIENAIYDFAGIENKEDLIKAIGVGDGLGYYTTQNGSDYEITPAGIAFMNEVLNGNYKGKGFFGDYLYKQDEALYDFMLSNVGNIRKYVGGLDQPDTESKIKQAKEDEAYREVSNYYKYSEVRKNVGDGKQAFKWSKDRKGEYNNKISEDIYKFGGIKPAKVHTFVDEDFPANDYEYQTDVTFNVSDLNETQMSYLKSIGGRVTKNSIKIKLTDGRHRRWDTETSVLELLEQLKKIKE